MALKFDTSAFLQLLWLTLWVKNINGKAYCLSECRSTCLQSTKKRRWRSSKKCHDFWSCCTWSSGKHNLHFTHFQYQIRHFSDQSLGTYALVWKWSCGHSNRNRLNHVCQFESKSLKFKILDQKYSSDNLTFVFCIFLI